jgi:hypothetical protein
MKISYVGNFAPQWSTENDVRLAFEHLGHEVVKLQENQVTMRQVREASMSSDLLLITSTWDDALPLNEMITLFKDMAQAGIPSATLHLDTFWGKSRGGRKWWLNPMFHTSYIFTADGDYQKEWELLGKTHVWLPPAVRHTAAKPGTYQNEYACDVAFVGSNGSGYHEDVWGYRKELVDFLRDMCSRHGWSFKNPGGDHPKVDREHMNDFYASAKVTVGDSLCLKKEESHYWSDRVPEACGRAGFLIMPQINAISDYFPELPMYSWGDFEELENLVGHYLVSDDERNAVVKDCQERGVKYNTYVNRAQAIIDIVGCNEKR